MSPHTRAREVLEHVAYLTISAGHHLGDVAQGYDGKAHRDAIRTELDRLRALLDRMDGAEDARPEGDCCSSDYCVRCLRNQEDAAEETAAGGAS